MNIEYVNGGTLSAADWRCTYVLKPDRKVLLESMKNYGWTSPIIASSRKNVIIDGHERWLIAANDDFIVNRDKGNVPVLWVDCDEVEAMLMHVRINRGRGQIQAKPLSLLLQRIVRSGAYAPVDFMKGLGMSTDEIDLLIEGGLVKQRKISAHKYSRAWIPVEAPKGAIVPAMNIERPPNADR